jgi:predicted phosphodiesterase
MRVAALYDIHGNLPALEAVLPEVDADLILVGGDFVAGPWASQTLERLRALGDAVRFIRGNADRELGPEAGGNAPAAVLDFVRESLSDEELEFVLGQPERESLDVDGLGRVLFCHATPRSDVELLTAASPEGDWREALSGTSESTVVCGHTHMQFDRRFGDARVVNAGSVGMPYEREPGAYWAVLGPGVELRRTPYQRGDIEGSGWPVEWPEATPEEATEFFEKLRAET